MAAGGTGVRARAGPVAALLALLVAVALSLPAGASPGVTTRVSVDSAGNQANHNSFFPAISDDGRYVAFSSDASNLVTGDTNFATDIFVHDRQTGATTRVSVDSAGNQANTASRAADISDDGRYVAFYSYASNLVAGDTNYCLISRYGSSCPDIFVHDRQTGATTRVSVDSAGNQANNHSNSHSVAISGDGRYVVFASDASNLVPADTNGTGDIFVHDRETGITTRVSVDSAGNQADRNSLNPDISDDGRYVAFESYTSNLVTGDTCCQDVFVRDRQTGTTTRVSVDSAGNQANSHSFNPRISGDGRFVAFESYAANLVTGDTCCQDVFVRDRQTGTTTRVSVDSAGNQADGESDLGAISDDGRSVAFISQGSNLAPGDTNGQDDAFVHDRQTGATIRVNVDSFGNQANERATRLTSAAMAASSPSTPTPPTWCRETPPASSTSSSTTGTPRTLT